MGGGPGTRHLSLAVGQCGPVHGRGSRVVLQGNGVYLAKKGYADGITFPGLTPLKTLADNYVANAAKFWSEFPASRSGKISQAD